MAINVEIQCIHKIPRNDPYDRIKSVGGVHNGKQWKATQKEAIQAIKDGTHKFHVGSTIITRVEVIVRGNPLTGEYLTTEPDGDTQNNLLSLRECP